MLNLSGVNSTILLDLEGGIKMFKNCVFDILILNSECVHKI